MRYETLGDNPLIAHLDMDAFYASVELLRRPELSDQPVAIGGRGDPKQRGVLTTANYVARKFGLRSGMPIRTAHKLCPQAVFLPVDFPEYRRVSRAFKAALISICPTMEDRGIDEVYLDLRTLDQPGAELAARLKRVVLEATGLTCSIGLAHNKLIAKIASDLHKPNGLSVIRGQDLTTTIWPLSANKVPGIGPKAYEKLTHLNLLTIEQVANAAPELLQEHFGPRYSAWLLAACWGQTASPVYTEQERKSYSRETTFNQDLHSDEQCAQVLAVLARQLEKDLRGKSLLGRTIGVKLRFQDFTTVTRDRSLAEPTSQARTIYETAWDCFDRIPRELGHHQKVRLLGIRITNLLEASEVTTERQTDLAL